MTRPPLVSVVVPFYNRRRYLRECALSILAEKARTELIMVDDGSTDGGAAEVADLPVTVITRKLRGGPACALNAGIAAGRGDYFGFLGSDDLLVRGGIDWRVAWLNQNPGAVAVAGAMGGIVDKDGKSLKLFHAAVKKILPSPPSEITMEYFRRGAIFVGFGNAILFRRSAVERVGPLDESLESAEDKDFVYRILGLGPIAYFDRPTFIGRWHPERLTWKYSGGRYRRRPKSVAEGILVDLAHGVRPQKISARSRRMAARLIGSLREST